MLHGVASLASQVLFDCERQKHNAQKTNGDELITDQKLQIGKLCLLKSFTTLKFSS